MIILNPALLATFRTAGNCELCHRWCLRREVHHIFSTGSCGGQLDIRPNLIAVGPMGWWECTCHSQAQAYKIPRAQVLGIVAKRENVTVDWITDLVYWIRRTPKPLGGPPTYEELVKQFENL